MPAKLAALVAYLKTHPLYLAGGAAGLIVLGIVIYYATRKSSTPVAAALPTGATYTPPPSAPGSNVVLKGVMLPHVAPGLESAQLLYGLAMLNNPYAVAHRTQMLAQAAKQAGCQPGQTFDGNNCVSAQQVPFGTGGWHYHASGGCWSHTPTA